MRLNLDTAGKLNIVYQCLCSGLPFFVDYGFRLDYDNAEYSQARKSLTASRKAEGNEETICIEDIQREMLRLGFALNFIGGEGNDDDHVTPLTLAVIEKNWGKIDKRYLTDMLKEEDDANTADCIMQGILFGEIVYG